MYINRLLFHTTKYKNSYIKQNFFKMLITFDNINSNDPVVIAIKYKPLLNLHNLKRLIKECKFFYKNIPTPKKQADIDPVLTSFNKLTKTIFHIASYRAVYSTQFPKKKKKVLSNPPRFNIKVKTGVHGRFFSNHLAGGYTFEELQQQHQEDIEEQTNFYKDLLIDNTDNVYLNDVVRRIEKILDFELLYSEEYNTLLPKSYFEKLITVTSELKPIYHYVLKSSIDNYAFKYKDVYFATVCGIPVLKSENTNDTELIPLFFSKNMKECPTCYRIYTNKVIFETSKIINEPICKTCIRRFEEYKPPKWNVTNIYHDHYHGNRSGWKFIPKRKPNDDTIPIGMELETEFLTKKHNKSRNELALALWQELGCKDILFERDGSLNEAGIECITNPMSSQYARDYWLPVKKALKNLTNGIYSGLTGYAQGALANWWGIHLTFARRFWTEDSLGKFVNFIHCTENKEFIQIIAQRTNNFGGGEVGAAKNGYKKAQQYMIKDDFNFTKPTKNKENDPEKIYDNNRMTSVNLTKEKYVEVRMFQTTNDVEEILKNYDFIQALKDMFTNEKTGPNTSVEEFLNWLFNPAKKEHVEKYMYLIKYLKRPSFEVRSGSKVLEVKNPFLKFTNRKLITQ